MAEVKGNKKRLSINLSLFSLTDHSNNTSSNSNKSPKKFEDPNGTVVGLGIVAAMNNNNNGDFSVKSNCSRAAIIAISPRSTTSNPIPIFTSCNNKSMNPKKKCKKPSIEEMEMCEEYTCVISHLGSNLIKKREYFDGEFIGNSNSNAYQRAAAAAAEVVASVNHVGETAIFRTADFLNSCFLCNKQLQGLDIFMYRGEKAFCSAECRCKQISMDEHKETCGSGAMKSLNEYPASPCSGPMQFFTGVAVA